MSKRRLDVDSSQGSQRLKIRGNESSRDAAGVDPSSDEESVDENVEENLLQTQQGAFLRETSNEIVRYLLTAKQKDCPTLKSDIVKHCLDNSRTDFEEVFQLAVNQLEDTFGITVQPITTATNNRPAFMLINKLEPPPTDSSRYPAHLAADPSRTPNDLGALYLVLCFLRLKNPETKTCPEKTVLEFLDMVQISPDKRHEQLGDFKKMLHKDWAQKKFVRITKIVSADGGSFSNEIGWGERAELETNLDNFLGRFCEVYGEGTPEDFLSPT